MQNGSEAAARPVVLVTAAALARPAVTLLEGAGYRVLTLSGYPSREDLIAAIAANRPVALLHRQGVVDGAVLDAGLPHLRMVARHGAGIDGIDVEAARARGVTVTRSAGANARAVAEHTLALMLALLKDLPPIAAGMAAGLWEKTSRQPRDVEGRRLGIVGYGAIGSKVARYADAFGMEVVAYDPYLPGPALPGPGERVGTLDALLDRADVLTLHCPLTAETRGMIDARALARLPADAIVVNAARGGVVREADLVAALDTGRVAGAGIDVFETEPLPAGHVLRHHPRVIATPHIAASTPRGGAAMAAGAAECIASVLAGRAPALAGAIVTLGERTPLAEDAAA